MQGDQLFSVGGPTTVRVYPTNTVAGDSGYYFNLELHSNMIDLIQGLEVFAFIDSGSVYSMTPAKTQLDSSGAGASRSPVPALTIEASVGVPRRKVTVDQPLHQLYGRITVRPLLLL